MNRRLPVLRRASTVLAVLVCCLSALVALPSVSSAATATVSPTSENFGNAQVGDVGATKTVTVTISSGYQLDDVQSDTGTSITVNPGSPYDYTTTNVSSGCYYPNVGAGKCQISVAFTPQEVGVSNATLSIDVCKVSESAVCTTYAVALTGNGTAPGKVSPTSISFGAVPEGVTSSKPVTVTVDAGWIVADASASGDQSFGVTDLEPDCSDTGPSTCTFSATFTPYDGAGVTGSANVTFCKPDGSGLCATIAIPLSGTGTSAATLSPTSIAFGTVVTGTVTSKTVSVKVLGGWYVGLLSAGDAPYDYDNVGSGCGPTGPVTCTFDVTYSPTDDGATTGSAFADVCDISGQHCDLLKVTLSGTAKSAGTVSPTSLAYGNVKIGVSTPKTVTVTYLAGWYVSGVSFDAHSDLLSSNATSTCSTTNPGTKCVFTASFEPQALGAVAANMLVTICQTGGSLCAALKPVPIAGTGIAAATQTPSSLAFGSVAVLRSSTKTYTVKPDPGWYVQKVNQPPSPSPYSGQLESDCAAGAGTPCTVDVTFAPTFAGSQSSKIDVELCQPSSGLCYAMTAVLLSGAGVQTATTTKLTAQTVRPNLGFADQLSATVSPAVDGGNVFFYAGSQVVCEVAVTNSAATCTWSPTHTGTYLLKAIYAGDAAFKTSTSNSFNATAVAPPP